MLVPASFCVAGGFESFENTTGKTWRQGDFNDVNCMQMTIFHFGVDTIGATDKLIFFGRVSLRRRGDWIVEECRITGECEMPSSSMPKFLKFSGSGEENGTTLEFSGYYYTAGTPAVTDDVVFVSYYSIGNYCHRYRAGCPSCEPEATAVDPCDPDNEVLIEQDEEELPGP